MNRDDIWLAVVLISVLLVSSIWWFRAAPASNPQEKVPPINAVAQNGRPSARLKEQLWSEYQNTTCGYKVQYPQGSIISDNGCDVEVTVSLGIPAAIAGGSDDFVFRIMAKANPKDLSPESWSGSEFAKLYEESPESVVQRQRFSVDGVPGFSLTIAEGDSNRVHIYISRNGRMYELNYLDPTSLFGVSANALDHWQSLLDTMMKSFRFLPA